MQLSQRITQFLFRHLHALWASLNPSPHGPIKDLAFSDETCEGMKSIVSPSLAKDMPAENYENKITFQEVEVTRKG